MSITLQAIFSVFLFLIQISEGLASGKFDYL